MTRIEAQNCILNCAELIEIEITERLNTSLDKILKESKKIQKLIRLLVKKAR